MTLCTLIDAELAFGDVPLLDHAALSVQDGERIGLIGRNGTGKSSLLGVLAGRIALDDERERWRIEARLDEFLQRLGVDGARDPASASGGERKRAALALAFALGPDLLLLDEPTNHLDVQAIEQLEALVIRAPAAIVITHDRAFLDHVATRIVELDRGVLRSYPGNFAAYTQRKEEELATEAVARRRFDKFWAQEEVWIRKGIEARRTRNEGRVRRLQQLRGERAERRERVGQVRLTLDAGERSGKRVAELEGVSKSFGGRPIVRDLDLRLMRGDRLALIGPNGAGKSTLLKLILGTLAPDAGRVTLGTQLEVAYFDQMRAQLDPEKTVAETIAPGSDWIEVGGSRKHVMSYLGDFLFPPRRASAPVRTLSGGERNRLLLARLFARPANLLVLDEPTNDLDIDSLELLESTLQDYRGTLLLVSHDRAFVDAIATQTLVSEGDGRWREYVGGYSDWIAQRPADAAASSAASGSTSAPTATAADAPTTTAPAARERQRVKLSYKEQRALESLPAQIEALEAEHAALHAAMAGADYHQASAEQMRADAARVEAIDTELGALLEQWTTLEDKARLAAEGRG